MEKVDSIGLVAHSFELLIAWWYGFSLAWQSIGGTVLVVLPFSWQVGGAEATPSVGTRRADDRLAIYLRCIVAAFASIRRWNPQARLILATDATPPLPFANDLKDVGVEMHLTPFGHLPPENFAPAFRTSMYMLDALRATLDIGGWEHLVVVDPDIVCIRPLEDLLDAVGGGVGAYPLQNYAPDHSINGLSRREAGEIHRNLGDSVVDIPTHYGGELIVVSRDCLPNILERSEVAWEDSLQRFRKGIPHFVTEEHVLSYALAEMPVVDLSPHVRRIWTAAIYRDLRGDEMSLALWHLPSEKRRGFRKFYELSIDTQSWWWKSDLATFRMRVGKVVGIPRRAPKRFIYDFARSSRIGVRIAG